MQQQTIDFTSSATTLYFDASFKILKELAPTEHSFIITDENLMFHYQDEFKPWKVITIPAGEESKSLNILDDIIRQLIALEAGRDAIIIGIGGGVVTDIAGFVAGIYKRGVRCGFVPTSILAMVDAAIGGKNGLDIGEYKNMMGLIKQPEFLLCDYSLLKSLPQEEWINGFAEIIKHACICDAEMFALLERYDIKDFQKDRALLHTLISRNTLLKAGVVQADEWETGERKKLNFGHTLAHAIENVYQLPHGHAVSIGMAFAANLSKEFLRFDQAKRITDLLEKYKLPVSFPYDRKQALNNMLVDKKREQDSISYILLSEIGKAITHPIAIDEIRKILN
ncbi:MAG: 3-dehydroquinate synthase [Taibaiella sp.]